MASESSPFTSSHSGSAPVPDGFGSTEWSLVLAASTESGPALDRLCRMYWRPVYVYMRASGADRTESEDLTQDFFADMLQRDWLKRADPDRGSFRAFLRTNARLFLSNRRRMARATKRGGADSPIPFDAEQVEHQLAREIASQPDPSQLYEQSWADCVLQAAQTRLADEQSKAGLEEKFRKLKPFLTHAPQPGEYGRLAEELHLTRTQVAAAVHRLSQRFAELVRAEVAETLSDRTGIEDELRYLLQLVSQRK